jgi:hypothetical protein
LAAEKKQEAWMGGIYPPFKETGEKMAHTRYG